MSLWCFCVQFGGSSLEEPTQEYDSGSSQTTYSEILQKSKREKESVSDGEQVKDAVQQSSHRGRKLWAPPVPAFTQLSCTVLNPVQQPRY